MLMGLQTGQALTLTSRLGHPSASGVRAVTLDGIGQGGLASTNQKQAPINLSVDPGRYRIVDLTC
jgi:hypothetical protein